MHFDEIAGNMIVTYDCSHFFETFIPCYEKVALYFFGAKMRVSLEMLMECVHAARRNFNNSHTTRHSSLSPTPQISPSSFLLMSFFFDDFKCWNGGKWSKATLAIDYFKSFNIILVGEGDSKVCNQKKEWNNEATTRILLCSCTEDTKLFAKSPLGL